MTLSVGITFTLLLFILATSSPSWWLVGAIPVAGISHVFGAEEGLDLKIPFELLATTDSLEQLGLGFESELAIETWVERVKVGVAGCEAGPPPRKSTGLGGW